ncbi:MAG: HAD family phosphatase [Clostridia bacterium]|nr:HAD family phosphatase [Clostridia bacterium]
MKLLALDLDNTTLSLDGSISPENRRAIEYVQNSGGYAVIITGRSPDAALPVWEMLPVHDICSCFGGAVLTDMRKGEIIKSVSMSPVLLKKALDIAHELGLVAQIYQGNKVITEYENPYTDRYMKYLKLKECIIEPDMRNMLFEDVVKVLCFTPESDLRSNISVFENAFQGELGISASGRSFIEINNPTVDKGTGLMSICKYLGVDIKDTVAMGDSLLDIPMIKSAGVGIAVQNAQDEVLKSADVISPDCDHDAVAWAVERWF